MAEPVLYAPGQPGIAPRRTSGALSGVGTSISPTSRVWFTISHGILNEIYYPDVDQACTRDMGLIVTDGRDFFSEERLDAASEASYLAEGVPAYHLVNTCEQGLYRIEKYIITDALRPVVLQQTQFIPLEGSVEDYHLYVLLGLHLANRGAGNNAFIDEYKGMPMLFAERDGDALSLACSAPWLKRSVGFAGTSDGWQDLREHKLMKRTYSRAENGNVSLTAEIDLKACDGKFVLALGFGRDPAEAANRARAGLLNGFEAARDEYIRQWREWQDTLSLPENSNVGGRSLARISAAVLRAHQTKRFEGAMIASLSMPWGFDRGDDGLGGYHLVWSRDLVEVLGALMAAGARDAVRRGLSYLHTTQEPDGSWPQNMRLDGTRYWGGAQANETAFPVLLTDLARRDEILESSDLKALWPMVRRAAGFLARNGPVTRKNQWDEDAGFSPFTLAVEIAALLAAADLADQNGEPSVAAYLRETADAWNVNIENWTYFEGTELAQEVGVDGYYARIASPGEAGAGAPNAGYVHVSRRPVSGRGAGATHIISPEALALVRFGLRMPDDPRIADTMKVVDALLKVDTPFGPAWHRYSDDQYGEHDDGSPFDGTGKGRLWPVLVGERAHYELAAGRRQEAERLAAAMAAFAGGGGMIPEQVWDQPDIPEKELFFGRASGSAMPSAWAHAEYIKLLCSLKEGRVFDMPQQTIQRYLIDRTDSPFAIWRPGYKTRKMSEGKKLRLETLESATVRWTADGWNTMEDTPTRETGLGVCVADLPTEALPEGTTVKFTFRWKEADRWEGTDFEMKIVSRDAA